MKTKQINSGRKHKSSDQIQRLWGDIGVVDAKNDLRVFIHPEDIRKATRKDPGCCVFAEACKRQFSATKVLFWRSVAYVELPGPGGLPRVERFLLSSVTRRLIENFDKGNDLGTNLGFDLIRPKPSMTLKAKTQRNRKTALLKGISKVKSKATRPNGRFNDPAIVIDLSVRNGSGRVQFKKELQVRHTEGA
jgi:hypothetical protein